MRILCCIHRNCYVYLPQINNNDDDDNNNNNNNNNNNKSIKETERVTRN